MLTPILLEINTRSDWNTIWGAISGAWPGFGRAISLIGTGLLLFSLIKLFIDKRKGGGGGQASKGLLWTFLLAAIMLGPEVVIPVLCTLLDAVLNMIIGIAKMFGNG